MTETEAAIPKMKAKHLSLHIALPTTLTLISVAVVLLTSFICYKKYKRGNRTYHVSEPLDDELGQTRANTSQHHNQNTSNNSSSLTTLRWNMPYFLFKILNSEPPNVPHPAARQSTPATKHTVLTMKKETVNDGHTEISLGTTASDVVNDDVISTPRIIYKEKTNTKPKDEKTPEECDYLNVMAL